MKASGTQAQASAASDAAALPALPAQPSKRRSTCVPFDNRKARSISSEMLRGITWASRT